LLWSPTSTARTVFQGLGAIGKAAAEAEFDHSAIRVLCLRRG
jgi:hypothetical protein